MTRKTTPQSGAGTGPQPDKGKAKSAGSKRRSAASAARGAPAVRDPQAAREAQRYARPIPSREAILALLEERGELLTEARIAAALAIDEAGDL